MKITKPQLRRMIKEAMPAGGIPDIVGTVTGVYGEENRQKLDDLGDTYSDMHKELYGRRPNIPMFKSVEAAEAAVSELWQEYKASNEEEDERAASALERQEMEKQLQSLMPDEYDLEKPMRSGMGRSVRESLREIIKSVINETSS